ncbi:MAG: hypothetical protein K0U98_10165 [Deltaproteobacteria bacterium]|nr:hypothetical protein [Deltaproteobacteria bacterium]
MKQNPKPSPEDTTKDVAPQKRARRPRKREEPLPWWSRLLLLLAGWLLLLIGIAGLVLPGIQGILTIFVGAAVLSLVSELAYDLLRWAFRRWPRGWRRVIKLRRRIHRWFHPKADPEDSCPKSSCD